MTVEALDSVLVVSAGSAVPVSVINKLAWPVQVVVSITPSNFKLPEGAGCTGDVARFRAIMANDLETGHTTKKVYDEIEGEMKKAEAICASGNSGGASAHVRSTKSRYGYP